MRNCGARRSTSVTLALVASVMVLIPSTAANAQGGLRDRISDLFIFGPGQSPLFLAGSGDPSNPIPLQAHGLHFIPSSSAENASLIAFITDALGASVANIPIGSTSGGETFRLEGARAGRTSASARPSLRVRTHKLLGGREEAGDSRNGRSVRPPGGA